MNDIESNPSVVYSKDEINALLKGSKAILAHKNFETSARLIFDTCKELIGAEAGYIALLSDDGSENEVLFLDPGGMSCTVDESLPMPIRGLRAEAYHQCKAVYHNNFSNSDFVKYMPQGHVHLQNVLFAPLIIDGKAVGLMGISNKPTYFTDHDAELASTFGEYAAIALNNSRMLDSLNKAKTDLETLNRDLEQKVQERTMEITSLLKQKEDFIQHLSHDLKNPLGPLVSLLPVLKEACDKPEYCQMLDTILRNVHYMKNLVQKSLELVQLNSSSIPLRKEDIHLRSFIDEIISTHHIFDQEHSVSIENNISNDMVITADRFRLQEVFTNLFDNSITYGSDNHRIQLFASQEQNNLIISVKDNGVGLTSEQITHVFDEFYKADLSRHDFKNTGLGLSITKKIVEKHGGNIWAESEGIGKGSVFTMSLPIQSKHMAEEMKPSEC